MKNGHHQNQRGMGGHKGGKIVSKKIESGGGLNQPRHLFTLNLFSILQADRGHPGDQCEN